MTNEEYHKIFAMIRARLKEIQLEGKECDGITLGDVIVGYMIYYNERVCIPTFAAADVRLMGIPVTVDYNRHYICRFSIKSYTVDFKFMEGESDDGNI